MGGLGHRGRGLSVGVQGQHWRVELDCGVDICFQEPVLVLCVSSVWEMDVCAGMYRGGVRAGEWGGEKGRVWIQGTACVSAKAQRQSCGEFSLAWVSGQVLNLPQVRGYSIIWVPAKGSCQTSPARSVVLCGSHPPLHIFTISW